MAPQKVLDYLQLVDLKHITIGILGSWAIIEETNELIDIDLLPYPNRQLKTRLRQAFIDIIKRKIEEEKKLKRST